MSTTKKAFFISGSPAPRILFLFGMELGGFTEWDLRGSDIYIYYFPGGSDGKASVYDAGDPGSIPGSGRSLEKEMATHSSTLA